MPVERDSDSSDELDLDPDESVDRKKCPTVLLQHEINTQSNKNRKRPDNSQSRSNSRAKIQRDEELFEHFCTNGSVDDDSYDLLPKPKQNVTG